MNDAGTVTHTTDARRFTSPANEDVVVLEAGDGSPDSFDLLEMTVPPGPGVTPLHIHHDNDEGFYVLEGELTVRIEDETHVLEAGEYALGPRGVPHTYRNSGERPARVLILYAPGAHWRMLEEAGAKGPVEDESDIEDLAPILDEYGVEMVGRPLE